MKSPEEIVQILKSIDGVRINEKTKEFEVLFNPPSTTYPDGWETNDGFNYQSFTQELLLLIEAHLRGETFYEEETKDESAIAGCRK